MGVDGLAPAAFAESLDIFMLGEVESLDEDLRSIGQGRGGFGFDMALGGGGEDAREGRAEVAGGEVVPGSIEGEVAAELVGGAGLGFFASMEVAEMGMSGVAWSAATAAVGEGEGTESRAIFAG